MSVAAERVDITTGKKIRIVVLNIAVFAVLAVAAVWAFNTMFPGKTVYDCIADNVEMYVENQAHGPNGGWVASEAGKQSARDQAQHACERFSDAG